MTDTKKKPLAEPDTNKRPVPDEPLDSYGSGNAFEETENPVDESEKDLSDEQLDELLSEE